MRLAYHLKMGFDNKMQKNMSDGHSNSGHKYNDCHIMWPSFLWPSLLWPSLFVAVVVIIIIIIIIIILLLTIFT